MSTRRRETIDTLCRIGFKATGFLVIGLLTGIFLMLVYNSIAFFGDVSPLDFFTGRNGTPTASTASFP